MESQQYNQEVKAGTRFEFGKNWANFLKTLNEDSIVAAENSFKELLDEYDFTGKTFLDIGSGSGLSSLVAKRLGAKVHSFDFDPHSVASTRELKRRFFPNHNEWTVEEGSVLNGDYMKSLGHFDFVYSWGVLHHTGSMWKAIENAQSVVKDGGVFFIAIYNDQGNTSKRWTAVKRLYCSGFLGRWLTKIIYIPIFFFVPMASDVFRFRNPLKRFTDYKKKRGMSIYHDWIDWLGGYPFEVAKVEDLVRFLMPRGFTLQNLKTTNSLGCNELVFRRK